MQFQESLERRIRIGVCKRFVGAVANQFFGSCRSLPVRVARFSDGCPCLDLSFPGDGCDHV